VRVHSVGPLLAEAAVTGFSRMDPGQLSGYGEVGR
jgi:hypothetical protein